jgi:hypothetical protein
LDVSDNDCTGVGDSDGIAPGSGAEIEDLVGIGVGGFWRGDWHNCEGEDRSTEQVTGKFHWLSFRIAEM